MDSKNSTFRRWLDGRMTWREQARLEQDLRKSDDPFLKDAWEGYQSRPSGKHEDKLDEIRQRLEEKAGAGVSGQSRRLFPIWLPQAVAASAVLLIAVLAVQRYLGPEKNANLVQTDLPVKEEKANTSGEGEAPAPIAMLDKKQTEALKPGDEPLTNTPSPKPISSEASKGKAAQINAEASAGAAPEIAELISTEAFEEAKSEAASPPPTVDPINKPTPSSPNIATDQAKDLKTRSNVPNNMSRKSANFLGGNIRDEAGKPLNGIPIETQPQRFSFTNYEGDFELPPNAPEQVTISPLGFTSQILNINEPSEQVVLQREVNAKKRSFEKSDRSSGTGVPRPVGGFEALSKHIKENLEMPWAAKQSSVSGDVVLEFRFKPDGTPTQVSVIRGIGFGCDQEAIHLIESGPLWENVDKKTSVVYKIRFK
jgi:hypothetical protein